MNTKKELVSHLVDYLDTYFDNETSGDIDNRKNIVSQALEAFDGYNLLAASPELLEACKEVAEGIRFIKHELPQEIKQPYLKMLAAISKAENNS
jgi:DNA-binding NarL/FixJ family response regulator